MVDFVGNWEDDGVIEHMRIKLKLEVMNKVGDLIKGFC